MNLSLHPAGFPATLEKWYIDTLLDDGSILLVYLGTLTLVRVRLARLTAELFLPQGHVLRGSATARQIRGGEGILHFGPATIDGHRLRFTTVGLSGDLIYQPRYSSCMLREPFLVAGDRTLHWAVEIPDADVTGRLAWPGGSCTVIGRGYRDRVWFDIPPGRFPIRELIWGRAAAGEHAATWVRATTEQEVIAASWLDGHIVATADSSVPPADVALGRGHVFLDADVAALEGLHLGALRDVLRRLSGDPHETKWRAPCMIAGVEGIAVHEVVRWHV